MSATDCVDCGYALGSAEHIDICVTVRCKGDCCEVTTDLDAAGFCSHCNGDDKREAAAERREWARSR